MRREVYTRWAVFPFWTSFASKRIFLGGESLAPLGSFCGHKIFISGPLVILLLFLEFPLELNHLHFDTLHLEDLLLILVKRLIKIAPFSDYDVWKHGYGVIVGPEIIIGCEVVRHRIISFHGCLADVEISWWLKVEKGTVWFVRNNLFAFFLCQL